MYAGSKPQPLSSYVGQRAAEVRAQEAADKAVTKYVAFKAPPLDKSEQSAELQRSRLASVHGWRSINTIPLSVIPEKYRPKASGELLVNNLLTFTVGGYDGVNYNTIATSSLSDEDKKAIVTAAQARYEGNGCLPGLITRIAAEFPSAKRVVPPLHEEVLEFIQKHLPRKELMTLAGDGVSPEDLNPEIRGDSHPGAPYFYSTTFADVAPDALMRAKSYYVLLSEKGPNALIQRMQDQATSYEGLVILQSKRDIYKRDEYKTKARPYYITPSAIKVLAACIIKPYKLSLHTFLTHPDSMNAVGFSWAHGGAEKLVKWAYGKRPPGVLAAASWGDDQLWTTTLPSGHTVIMAPDVRGMDMKLQPQTFDYARVLLLQTFHKDRLTLASLAKEFIMKTFAKMEQHISFGWFAFILFYIHWNKNSRVLAFKQFVYQLLMALRSGVPGTTEFDVVASGQLVYAVSRVRKPAKLEDVPSYVEALFRAADIAGFPLKEEEVIAQVVEPKVKNTHVRKTYLLLRGGGRRDLPPNVLLGLPFLGMQVVKYAVPAANAKDGKAFNMAVPVMDLVDVGVNCILKTKSVEDKVLKNSTAMQQIVGRAMFAFADKRAYDVLYSMYDNRVKAGWQILPQDREPVFPGVEDADTKEFFEGRELAPPLRFARVFMTAEQRENVTFPEVIPPTPAAGAYALEPVVVNDDLDVVVPAGAAKDKKKKTKVEKTQKVKREGGELDAVVPTKASGSGPSHAAAAASLVVPEEPEHVELEVPSEWDSDDDVPPPPPLPAAPAAKAAAAAVATGKTLKEKPVKSMISLGNQQTLANLEPLEEPKPSTLHIKPQPNPPATHVSALAPNEAMRRAKQERYLNRQMAILHDRAEARAARRTAREATGEDEHDGVAEEDDDIEALDDERRAEEYQAAMDALIEQYNLDQEREREREERLESSESEDEEDLYYDPTNAKHKQGKNYFIGD